MDPFQVYRPVRTHMFPPFPYSYVVGKQHHAAKLRKLMVFLEEDIYIYIYIYIYMFMTTACLLAWSIYLL